MQDKFTRQLEMALQSAQEVAKNQKHSYIGTEHILVGLAKTDNCVASKILASYDVTASDILKKMSGMISPLIYERGRRKLEYTPRAQELLDLSVEEAIRCNTKRLGTEHVLMAILRNGMSAASRLLVEFNLDARNAYMDIVYAIGEDPAKFKDLFKQSRDPEAKVSSTPTLDKFGRDLTKLALEGKLDTVIGRYDEIDRIVQILSRRMKNNPCLIGEAGVGKTAIIEGLANKIIEGDVPKTIQNKRLLSMDLSGIVAGTKYRGEFEDRIQNIISEVSKAGNVILFIDEIHTIIGAGGAEGALDASNILKPSLSRGEIQLIGSTTIDEYRKYIEQDPALERRFQPILVEEPTEKEAIAILEGIVDRYEAHHGVSISQDAIESAVYLSNRYINDRFLPDKAIDLIDEASARVNLDESYVPENIKKLEAEIKSLNLEKESAIRKEKFEKAGEIKTVEDKKKRQLERAKERWINSKEDKRPVVTESDIANLVSKWTKIPTTKLEETETDRLKKLEQILHNRVIGQNEAVEAVAKAVRRGRVGIKDPNRPIGSFMFLGPTGVGKTELSKALAEAVFGNEDAMIRVDMSEYMEKHSVSKMIGSPPGYVGYDEGGQLSEKVRRNPYSVILFDEVEKAHPDVFNILLQVLDDGHITDTHGRKVSFKNTILIMTSNIGAEKIVEPKRLGFSTEISEEKEYELMKNGVMDEMKKAFRPEFINRIDETIVFHSLTRENVKDVVKIMADSMAKRIKEQLDITIRLTSGAKDLIADMSYDKKFGARPLRRTMQKEIEDRLAMEILEGNIKRGDHVVVSGAQKKIKLTSKNEQSII